MGIEKIPLIIPERWDPTWFRMFINEVLAPLDTRNSVGVGVSITSDGNSVATLDVTTAVDDAIAIHDALATAHATAFAVHDGRATAHATAFAVHDGLATAHAAAFDAHRAETDPHPDLIDDLTATSAVAEADYVMVSQSGTNKKATLNQVGEAVFGDDWDDLTITGTAVNPPGAASDPKLSNTTGLLEFTATADQQIIFVWQIPHGWSGAWDSSTAMATVVPHLHVRHLSTTSAPTNVSRWKFEYDRASVNGNFANAYGSFTDGGTVSSTNPANTFAHSIISFGNLNLSGSGISTMLHARVSRLASSDGADTETSDIALYSADIHLRRRRWGTENEYND